MVTEKTERVRTKQMAGVRCPISNRETEEVP